MSPDELVGDIARELTKVLGEATMKEDMDSDAMESAKNVIDECVSDAEDIVDEGADDDEDEPEDTPASA